MKRGVAEYEKIFVKYMFEKGLVFKNPIAKTHTLQKDTKGHLTEEDIW